MVDYKYAYLVGNIICLLIWVGLYWYRKDVRREMIFMSILIAFSSVITAYFWWTIDWWRPQTITNTKVGIEDFILGFSNGGIAAVLYEELFKKRLYKRKPHHNDFSALSTFLLSIFIISFLFWGIGSTSFVASSIGMTIAGLVILSHRPDLFINALASGLLTALVFVPVYWILIWIFPGWVETTWLFKNLTGILITGIPLEDIVFYFIFGFVTGPFYEYWKGTKLVKFKNTGH